MKFSESNRKSYGYNHQIKKSKPELLVNSDILEGFNICQHYTNIFLHKSNVFIRTITCSSASHSRTPPFYFSFTATRYFFMADGSHVRSTNIYQPFLWYNNRKLRHPNNQQKKKSMSQFSPLRFDCSPFTEHVDAPGKCHLPIYQKDKRRYQYLFKFYLITSVLNGECFVTLTLLQPA